MDALKNFARFPCLPDKRPALGGWQDAATSDPSQIAAWTAQGFKAWGIPCGPVNDLFVLDLDVCKTTGKRIGEASLTAIPRYGELLGHANVTTPTGGRHIYFRHFDGGRNTVGKLGAGIDTRGEGGYVVSPGSITNAGIYTGLIQETLPSVPLSLRAMLATSPRPIPQATWDREATVGEVHALLGHIPPDSDYAAWVAVLMALHDRYNGSDEGLSIADAWSAQGSKYKPGEVASKWRGFKGSGVSWATIPALARENGANLSEISREFAQ